MTKTLRELKKEISVEKKVYEKLPSTVCLAQSGAVVIAEAHMGTDNDILVYDNGYVAYREGNHRTVFRLLEVSDFYYQDDANGNELPWDYHLMLVGNDRIFSNICKQDIKKAITTQELGDWNMVYHDKKAVDPLEQLIQQESWNEILQGLSKKQAKVIQMLVIDRMKQKEIAEELGIGKKGVNNLVQRAFAVIKEKNKKN